MLNCFGPILACGRSFLCMGSRRSSRPAQISVEDAATDVALNSSATPFPNGRWIDAEADPNFRALEVMEAMHGSVQGTLWLHLAVKNLRIRAPFTQQYELFPLHWVKTGKPALMICESEKEDTLSPSTPIGDDAKEIMDGNFDAPDTAKLAAAEEVPCGICMDCVSNIELLPCRHDNFCQMCILRIVCHWNQSHGPGCPICRTPISTIIIADETLPHDTNAAVVAELISNSQHGDTSVAAANAEVSFAVDSAAAAAAAAGSDASSALTSSPAFAAFAAAAASASAAASTSAADHVASAEFVHAGLASPAGPAASAAAPAARHPSPAPLGAPPPPPSRMVTTYRL